MTDRGDAPGLTPPESRFLLELARETIRAAVADEPPPDPEAYAAGIGFEPTAALLQDRGAFVTLTLGGRLRGCIGTIVGIAPLIEVVRENALAAAFRDPRFAPLTADELDGLRIEISVLSPLRSVAGPRDIEIGRHGILLARGGARAVFLPQVAPEQGWDLPTTLDHLALKAGLSANDWREEGTEFQIFTAEIMAEDAAV